jgi:hypothetical protein
MHFIMGSIRADTLCANAQGSGTQHFSGVHSSVERLTSVPGTPLYPPLLIRIHSPVSPYSHNQHSAVRRRWS